MYVMSMAIFGEPIRSPLGDEDDPGRVPRRRPDLRVPELPFGSHNSGFQFTHFLTAGSQNRVATALRWRLRFRPKRIEGVAARRRPFLVGRVQEPGFRVQG